MTVATPPTETRRIHADGAELHVRLDGADGPWVILAHALAADHTLWDITARHLAGRYRVVRPDLRGHGASDAPLGPYTMTRLADDVVAVMDALQIPQAHFCGISVGGMVGQSMGLRHPERLLSLTLVATNSQTPMEAHPMWHNRIGQAEAHGMASLADATLGRWLSPAFHASHPDEVLRIRDMLVATPIRGYVGVAEAIMAFDLAGALSRIHCPTLVVAGEQDQGATVAMAQSIAAAIAGSRLEVVPQAAHLVHVEQPERFHAALDAFLGSAACGGQCDVP
ncbi:alpha/beta fold hydrolase [Cupriavidus taiwanensis]|uniref:B-KETOADIPATE ENOL-LACTONE HYDROLASE (Putative) n=1 Tax=Cupriavidus taiwanensis TaxID=164546 RepID=A0A7Z7J6Z7_9BURK|nr:alpha/beta fold hydrolase [Cupriavidus taiwanensis]SOY85239.1 B-KETOADIPATE ENOL-LACTONE HYDROLASE (putative) [Cupriavidus taiwanensis]SOY99862.1 B-KETOADIPATE ENOL-LACTONE HYDROLASE (putative) [Cupriavidus taiwanensis]SOZ02896.1 B-KETOADIPATE ENOL-LACTONE HYDROLASE (putative) [Cupriavidus taiwanensis]SPC06304.1 B-KETOADIPATE ENOL-LACTONE HYDROLASE (putative) [Cupriavidus taiwanensis]SPD38289.1 putative B-KETOADIPATE ENOL-LACTONE HYDROLASE () [Cupriavidus taiwanensis]